VLLAASGYVVLLGARPDSALVGMTAKVRVRLGLARNAGGLLEDHQEGDVTRARGTGGSGASEEDVQSGCRDCFHLPVPSLDGNDTGYTCAEAFPECAPEIFLLPSFPTSGNHLVQLVLSEATGSQAVTRYQEKKNMAVMRWSVSDGDEDSELPRKRQKIGVVWTKPGREKYSGRGPTLMKTHGTDKEGILGALVATGAVRGLVRLARNPGDHIYRNVERWKSNKAGNAACHTAPDGEKPKKGCDAIEEEVCAGVNGEPWAFFHAFWEQQASVLPVHIVRYEDLLFRPVETCAELFRFMRLDAPRLKDVATSVLPPTYDIGSEMAVHCGVTKAREVNSVTRAASEPLGYAFHEDTGRWSLIDNLSGEEAPVALAPPSSS